MVLVVLLTMRLVRLLALLQPKGGGTGMSTPRDKKRAVRGCLPESFRPPLWLRYISSAGEGRGGVGNEVEVQRWAARVCEVSKNERL